MITISSKRQKRWLTVAGCVAAAFVVFLLGRVTSPASGAHSSRDEHEHEHEQDGEQIYYCSMHPDQQSTDPNATCPICGMDMIPLPDDAGEDDGGPILRVSERAAALMNVEVAPVQRQRASSNMRFQGHVELDETRLADVVVRSDGFVERQHADYKWQAVRRGQPLAEIDSPAVTAAARELLVIRRAGEQRSGQVTLESGKEKLRRLGAPEDYITRVLETGEVPRTYTLRSPVSGVVTEIEGREGNAMSEGQRHVQIADLSRVWVQLQAYESDLPGLRQGQAVDVTTRAHPGETFEGTVGFIDPAVDAARRTVRIRLEVENPDGRLKPGMFVRGALRGGGAGEPATADPAPLVIPATAPLLTGRSAIVYVQRPGEELPTFEGREVELGSRVGDAYEVSAGLEAGDLVVIRGAFRIDSELQIRGRPSMMSPGRVFAGDEATAAAALLALGADEVPEAFADGAEALMQRYFELTSALAADDLDRARAAAAAVQEALGAVDASELPEDAGEAWNEVRLALTAPLAAMASAGEIDDLRDHLDALAQPMETVAKMLAGKTGLEIYRGTCPMTQGGTGHWLQREETLANPYMGQQMLGCGSIEPVTP